MNRWLLLALVAPLAACSQGGGSATPAPNFKGANCSVAQPVMAGVSTQSMLEDGTAASDPFEANGKVVFSDDATAFSGMSVGSSGLSAGTKLTVTVRDRCQNPGEISQAVFAAEGQANESTPAGVRSYEYELPRAMTMSELREVAESDSCVSGISEAGVAEISALPSDALVSTQQHLTFLEAGLAYDRFVPTISIKPVVVAVIDTGVDITHEDLKNVYWKNSNEIAGNGVDDDKNGFTDDANGWNFEDRSPSPIPTTKWGGYHHGTHVAGLTGAQGGNGVGGTGVMSSAVRLMALNVFGHTSGASVSAVANAMRYAADNGADVINLSLGGSGKNATYESAITYAIKKGVTVITASGNEGSLLSNSNWSSPGSYGSKFAGMINIGSLDSAANGTISYFSNYSTTYVELGSPGAENSSNGRGLLSTYPGNKYIRAMGTSMAAPVAAGGAAMAIALLRQRGYAPSPATVEAILETSAKTLTSLKTKIRDGRAMNLRNLADFIDRTYPATSGSGDPGVPGQDACQIATSQGMDDDSN